MLCISRCNSNKVTILDTSNYSELTVPKDYVLQNYLNGASVYGVYYNTSTNSIDCSPVDLSGYYLVDSVKAIEKLRLSGVVDCNQAVYYTSDGVEFKQFHFIAKDYYRHYLIVPYEIYKELGTTYIDFTCEDSVDLSFLVDLSKPIWYCQNIKMWGSYQPTYRGKIYITNVGVTKSLFNKSCDLYIQYLRLADYLDATYGSDICSRIADFFNSYKTVRSVYPIDREFIINHWSCIKSYLSSAFIPSKSKGVSPDSSTRVDFFLIKRALYLYKSGKNDSLTSYPTLEDSFWSVNFSPKINSKAYLLIWYLKFRQGGESIIDIDMRIVYNHLVEVLNVFNML